MNMSHHVVPCHLLFLGGRFEVDVVDVSLHLGDLFRFDGQTKFLKERRSTFSTTWKIVAPLFQSIESEERLRFYDATLNYRLIRSRMCSYLSRFLSPFQRTPCII